ncbi:hypothetical protein V1498_09515 [Peribacillus sp. SCS-26]
MVDPLERVIFLKELSNLLEEYKKCENGSLQEIICDDILLLCGVLSAQLD